MRQTAALLVVLALVAPPTNAFVTYQRRDEARSFQLYARYTPPLPVPPPPPPPVVESSPWDGLLGKLSTGHSPVSPGASDGDSLSATLDALLRDVSSKLESASLPSLSLPSVSMPAISLPSVSLPSMDTPLLLPDSLDQVRASIESFDQSVLDALAQALAQLQTILPTDNPALAKILPELSQVAASLDGGSPALVIFLSALITYSIVSAVLTGPPPPSQPYPLNKYDPIAARIYFDTKVWVVVGRAVQVFLQSLQFSLKLAQDKLSNKIADTEFERGKELAVLLTKLGPSFIKIGQSLSIRSDLLAPAYIRGLETLQDQVPPFDTALAKEILAAEWGRPVEEVLDRMPDEPIAAASLGQVYKARLKETGQEVAIKVQRPNIMGQIALDMHLLRELAPIVRRLGNLNSDTVGTVDAWGSGFVDELDYVAEGQNAEIFMEKLADTPLTSVVFAPKVVHDYSTQSVLVTEWVDGKRLDQSEAKDITVLCSIAMNTYLTMLLEMGILHCDPHPGNLFRTADGRLCILDWGMVTRLDTDLQLTLIEHMAHLTSGDYAEIPRDLLLLGFIPPEKAEFVEDSGVVGLLAGIYKTWTKGGGAAAFNVNDVINSLQDLTAEKGQLFQIPPYFAYIAKSFSVLEGIGLTNDAKYSIINECLPYVSQRLLTDDEKCGPALSTFIFGANKSDKDRFVEYDRVEQLVEGFGSYSTSASGSLLGKQDATRLEVLEQSADQILDLVFAEKKTPLQGILLEQLAKIMAASGRTVFTELRERSGTLPNGRSVLGSVFDPLGIFRTSPLVRATDLDERTIDTTRKLVVLAQKQLDESPNPSLDFSDLSREEGVAMASILVRKVWGRRVGVFQTGNRFFQQLLVLTAEQLEAGEQDRLSALPPAQEEETQPSPTTMGTQPVVPESPHSPRLEQARRLLDSYQEEGSEADVQYERVSTTLKV